WGNIAGLETEVAAILRSLDRLPRSHAEKCELAHATRESLGRMLAEWKPHVLHFAGHGGFPDLDDPEGDLDAPSLVLESAPEKKRRHAYLTATELRALCAQAGVQVVVLNCCWGGRSTPDFTGVAHTLTAAGEGTRPVPVVVAHQMPIGQSTAVGF